MNDAANIINLASYDVILVNSSAGKDSQAMLDYVVEREPLDSLELAVLAEMERRTYRGDAT